MNHTSLHEAVRNIREEAQEAHSRLHEEVQARCDRIDTHGTTPELKEICQLASLQVRIQAGGKHQKIDVNAQRKAGQLVLREM